MNNREKYQKWLEIAEYDLDSASYMYEGRRYIYVAFMCQQAVEKLAKGIYVYNFDKEPKYTHNINAVLDTIDSIVNLEEYEEYKILFSDLTTYYIVGRYNAYKQNLSKELDQDATKELLEKTKEAFVWLQSQVKL